MKTTWFTITPENAISAFATEQEARDSECRFAFADVGSLEVILQENDGLATELWNQLPGIVPGSAPGSIGNAAGKIWKRIQALASAVQPPAKKARVRAPGALAAAKGPKPTERMRRQAKAAKQAKVKGNTTAKNLAKALKTTRALAAVVKGTPKKEPTPKAAKPVVGKGVILIELLRRPSGATTEQVMKAMGWSESTTRSHLVAGRYLTRLGIAVKSEKSETGIRTYRIAS